MQVLQLRGATVSRRLFPVLCCRSNPASIAQWQRRAFLSGVSPRNATRSTGIALATTTTPPARTAFVSTTRRRQRSPTITVSMPSFCLPPLASIRTLSTSAGGSNNNNNNNHIESNNDSRNGKEHEPLSSSVSSSLPPLASSSGVADKETDGSSSPTTNVNSSNISSSSSNTSDPSMVIWVDDYLPGSLRPYAHLSRMDKPIGTWLLLWPCYWSTAMAAGVHTDQGITDDTATTTATTTATNLLDVFPDPKLLGLFTVGAFVMRGAGCTINDLWDRDLDRRVARTKTRPLAAGLLTPTQAVGWLAVQLTVGLGVLLSLQPHTEYCFWWGASSLPIVVAYPLMKRCFDYPQLVLGLCFNWGAFMGWAAVHGSMDYGVVLPLYASGVAWTIGYDTLYAHQDKVDDAKLGLRSTAITFGRIGGGNESESSGGGDDSRRHKRVLHGLAVTTYACWLLAGYNDLVATTVALAESTEQLDAALFPFGVYAAGITGAYAHLVWQIRTADLSDPHNLAERFRSNAGVGGLVFGSILAGKGALLL